VLVFTACSTSASGTPAAKVFGQTSFTGTTAGTFLNPWGVAVSTSGDLYVSDKNCKISVFSAANTLASGTTAATSSLAGTCGCSQTALNNPRGLSIGTISGVSVLIASDYGNGRLMGWNIPAANGAPATLSFGASSWSVCSPGAPVAPNVISGPSDAFVDPSTGALFVSDTLNNRVLVFDPATYGPALPNARVAASAVVGQAGSLSSGTAGSGTGNLNSPNDVIYVAPGASNPTDLLLIVDQLNNRVQSFQGNAVLVTNSSTSAYYYNYSYNYNYSYPNYSYYGYSSQPAAASSPAAGSSQVAGATSAPAGSSFVRPTQISGGARNLRKALKKSWKHHKKLLNQNFF
jgi:hypothetical protein